MNRKNAGRLKPPSSTRLLPVLLALLAYHASLLLPTSPSESKQEASIRPGSSSSSFWLSALSQHNTGRKTGAVGVGGSVHRQCQASPNHSRYASMLNQLHEQVVLGQDLPASEQIFQRDNHNLTGVCPTIRPSHNLESQSLCPWTLVRNYKHDRFPRLMYFARCLCGRCTGSGSARRLTSHSHRQYDCVPLYHQVAVIREVCQAGELHFHWAHESVPVGCVCAHPSANHVS